MLDHVDFASSSEDEFPDLDTIYERSRQTPRPSKLSTVADTVRRRQPLERNGEYKDGSKSLEQKSGVLSKSDDATLPSTNRRRKLGQPPNNPLLMPLAPTGNNEGQELLKVSIKAKTERRDGKRELRTHHRVTSQASFLPRESDGESDSAHEATEITEAEVSEYFGESSSMSEDGETPVFSSLEEPTSNTRHFSKSRSQQRSAPRVEGQSSGTSQTKQLDFPYLKFSGREKHPQQTVSKDENVSWSRSLDPSRPKSTPVDLMDETTDRLRRLELASKDTRVQEKKVRDCNAPEVTPPSTPPKQSVKSLLFPSIPQTPHGPGMDLFWSQEFVNEWNEEHSSKKMILPPAQKSPTKGKVKFTTKAGSTKQKETTKAFKQKKHELARAFLQELDETITHGRLHSLAEPTGGVKINWSSKLNTTAGRANWRRETVRSKLADGTECVTHRHHASIELAEKVIDDEHRLLNVVAHEFCHLANFMVNGITGNPHGKEFKVWAAKCSQEFGSRGIEVTTKHSYEIDFKYVWECIECELEYKRHSKSINPERHRCGSCKARLKQTKPVPRATGKTSEYQKFFKEQMKLIREEYPKSPQKEVMKIIADKWAKRSGSTCATPEMDHATPVSVADLDKVGIRLGSLSL